MIREISVFSGPFSEIFNLLFMINLISFFHILKHANILTIFLYHFCFPINNYSNVIVDIFKFLINGHFTLSINNLRKIVIDH